MSIANCKISAEPEEVGLLEVWKTLALAFSEVRDRVTPSNTMLFSHNRNRAEGVDTVEYGGSTAKNCKEIEVEFHS